MSISSRKNWYFQRLQFFCFQTKIRRTKLVKYFLSRCFEKGRKSLSGLVKTKILYKDQPFSQYLIRDRTQHIDFYEVNCTSIDDHLFLQLFGFSIKFYVLNSTFYAQPQNFIWGLEYPNCAYIVNTYTILSPSVLRIITVEVLDLIYQKGWLRSWLE